MNAALKVAIEDPQIRAKLIELGNTPRYEMLGQFKAREGRPRPVGRDREGGGAAID